ncbi:hypothetical protein JG687_00010809 [Phytophthora cactorum]|uniref:RxLR effector protein n=1 Tax=Phytophthora cactorum TaxID=29920 RepID=A0A329S494_9STRA|nr:hypothetical protein Pcac1_g3046 [Phytophthora cactorum]KAG2821776.1 hypothetical protein PC112_g11225 [Phytophthora cactorum]KAG2835641.1 hypothetical protein PC111_g5341 [Phytophthora cactorum]KAG2864339.1 hypothetical protein PC113_g4658 [Phytophthora cactorum]KAG2901910.1 hypothetical protein PC114_g12958 [Phytophthora cactorum]
MRLHQVVLAAAVAVILMTTSNGLSASVESPTKSALKRATTEAGNAGGLTERFLVTSEDEGTEDNTINDSTEAENEERLFGLKRRKKRKRSEEEEATPTPTPAPGNSTAEPTLIPRLISPLPAPPTRESVTNNILNRIFD